MSPYTPAQKRAIRARARVRSGMDERPFYPEARKPISAHQPIVRGPSGTLPPTEPPRPAPETPRRGFSVWDFAPGFRSTRKQVPDLSPGANPVPEPARESMISRWLRGKL